ncbi:hypothetical protein J6TS1_20080 [Siminovitchia terrae]|uniref:Uncharacterized protein n=1 Tax=Siminovitchia terrae TaxID=1914933 RepID=A0ABQ4KVS8_SIMTE|nr:hypothetical protein [Siminovitchia terrae]GIN96138.1 hypothetical protein J6TS1_20080 [Siminovitchia terrae]
MRKVINIKDRFSQELSNINNILTALENNRYYELTHSKMDGTVSHNANKLRKEISQLLYKIEYDKKSILDEFEDFFSNKK